MQIVVSIVAVQVVVAISSAQRVGPFKTLHHIVTTLGIDDVVPGRSFDAILFSSAFDRRSRKGYRIASPALDAWAAVTTDQTRA